MIFSTYINVHEHCNSFVTKMIEESGKLTSDVSVLRRLVFAAKNINTGAPGYWDLVRGFGFKYFPEKPDARKVQIFIENLASLDQESFVSDAELLTELYQFEGYHGNPLGILLISSKEICRNCGGKLLVRGDRPSFPMVYNENIGTIHGTHFRKYCENQSKGCHFVQHYGFYTTDRIDGIIYDDDYYTLPYFMSTSMTIFETTILKCFTAQMLIGQLSYKQKAEIYNYSHGYESKLKKSIPGRLPRSVENQLVQYHIYIRIIYI